MPSFNLAQFDPPSSSDAPPPPRAPTPPRPHLRAYSASFPAYLSSTAALPSDDRGPPPPPPPPLERRAGRRPLSKRYTRPASLAYLSQRSPLQSSSSSAVGALFSPAADGDGPARFEESLRRSLERKMRERVDAADRHRGRGGERGGWGGLKPGRELWIWTAVNRCSPTTTRVRGAAGHNGTGTGMGARTDPEPLKVDDEEEDDDDDEPLGRKLQEAIEKRERQIVRLQAERIATAAAKVHHNEAVDETASGADERNKEKKPPPRAVDVRVRVRLPASPEPAFLRPPGSGSTRPSRPEDHSPRPPHASAPGKVMAAFVDPTTTSRTTMACSNENLAPPEPSSSSLWAGGKRSKRLRKNPTASSSSSSSSLSVPLSTRSLSLPTLPPRVATPAFLSAPPQPPPGVSAPPPRPPRPSSIMTPLAPSRSENLPSCTVTTTTTTARGRRLSLGMKRSRSAAAAAVAEHGGGHGGHGTNYGVAVVKPFFVVATASAAGTTERPTS
ncbi:hypothetical protein JCM11491_005816 [Sporobolomyces phaffii]